MAVTGIRGATERSIPSRHFQGTGTKMSPASVDSCYSSRGALSLGMPMGILVGMGHAHLEILVSMHTIRCWRSIGVTRPHHYISSSCLDWRGTLEPSSMACSSAFWSIWPFSSSEATSMSGLDFEQQQEQHRLNRI